MELIGASDGVLAAHHAWSGQGRDRTADTRIFSPVLYQLSYLSEGLILQAFFYFPGFCC